MGLLNSKENENVELAKNMLDLGIDIEQVAQITGLPKEEVVRLLNGNNSDMKNWHNFFL